MPPEQPAPPIPTHHMPNWTKFGLSILGVFIIMGVVFFALKDPCFKENYFGAELTPKCAESLTPLIPSQLDTSTWQTYRNEEYGFEFKYPKNWMLDQNFENGTIIVASGAERVKQIKQCYEGCLPDILFSYTPDVSNFDEYANKPMQFLVKPTKITFQNHNAYEVLDYGYSTYFGIIIENNGGVLQILFGNASSKQEVGLIENQILSTFKFLEPRKQEPVACTADAMMCPDGTYVGRTGPNCEFVCP